MVLPLLTPVEFGLTCEYVRERKKRGKASRKDIAAQQAAAAAAAAATAASGSGTGESGPTSPGNSSFLPEEQAVPENVSDHDRMKGSDLPLSSSMTQSRTHSLPSPQGGLYGGMVSLPRSMGMENSVDPTLENGMHNQIHTSANGVQGSLPTPRLSTTSLDERNIQMSRMPEYHPMDDFHRMLSHPPGSATGRHHMQNANNMIPHPIMPPNSVQGYDAHYQMISPTSQQGPTNAFRIPTGDSPMSNFMGSSPVGASPGWFSMPSPTANGLYGPPARMGSTQSLRYPVLQPLLPHLAGILPVAHACDLLEFYFQSSASTFMQPTSPCVLGYIFRKRSFLRPTNPRVCSPALLASMLWIGAQTSEAQFLTSPPSARGKISQRLLELTIRLLQPLVHSPVPGADNSRNFSETVIDGVALGGFGLALSGRATGDEAGTAAGGIDDIATYMHLAVVVSASEYKAASLRWWNAAWSLARELKLARELPANPFPQRNLDEPDEDAPGEVDVDMDHVANGKMNGAPPSGQQTPGLVSEEEREERRRIWWLLYTMDRHLALCYNRPLFLLDVECDGLLQPVDDTIWQMGEYYNPDVHPALCDPSSPQFRRRGPQFVCRGHSIFGFFLPLMTILGEIVDLNQARNHPRFGLRTRNGSDWDEQSAEIKQQLEAYGNSLEDFAARQTASLEEMKSSHHLDGGNQPGGSPSNHSVNSSASRITESILQTKCVVAYGTHIMHTLHILLNGKWDPISLLDDNDLWISSDSFINATGHAVSAAEAINEILEHDPDLSFMPFFFGIYLLQGSFLLLLIADKLQGDASESVVKACETIVRAHEACVVTLNTEYQVCSDHPIHMHL